MRVLIVDDEPLARGALAKILSANKAVEHFDSAKDAIDAQEFLCKNTYDVVLLDINMPELSGFDLLHRMQESKRPIPAVVFVTAYAQHAVAAFEKQAADYVVKPFSSERVNRALEFASRRAAWERAAKFAAWPPQSSASKPDSKIAIKSNGRILFIDPCDIVTVQAEGNYVVLQRRSGSDVLKESISTIAEKLKPYGLVRIHRSVLVNACFVQEIRPCTTGEYQLRIQDGTEYTVTRTYKKNLKGLAAFWLGTRAFLTD